MRRLVEANSREHRFWGAGELEGGKHQCNVGETCNWVEQSVTCCLFIGCCTEVTCETMYKEALQTVKPPSVAYVLVSFACGHISQTLHLCLPECMIAMVVLLVYLAKV